MKKGLYNVLYAISNAALIFVVTYVVYFCFESMRLEFLRFYLKGTEYALPDTNTIYIAFDSILEGILTPVFGSFSIIQYVAILTLMIPVCHIIEIILDKCGSNESLRSYGQTTIGRILSVVPYVLIGLASWYYLKTNMYTLVDSASEVSMCTELYDTYTIGKNLKIAVYVVTLLTIILVAKYAESFSWSQKTSYVSGQATSWIDIKPLAFCVLCIIGVIYFIVMLIPDVEYRYYYY